MAILVEVVRVSVRVMDSEMMWSVYLLREEAEWVTHVLVDVFIELPLLFCGSGCLGVRGAHGNSRGVVVVEGQAAPRRVAALLAAMNGLLGPDARGRHRRRHATERVSTRRAFLPPHHD